MKLSATDLEEAAKRVLPRGLASRLGGLRYRQRLLGRRLRNSARAFQRLEDSYTLAIREVDGFRLAHRSGTADEDVIAHSLSKDTYLGAIPGYSPQPGHIVIDIGAHIGTFALLVARQVAGGTVHAVEASRETFDYLTVNVALNAASNVVAHRLALTDRKGVATLHHDEGNWGHSLMQQLTPYGEEVATDTLDGFMADNAIERADLVKFNCEGAEFPILMAASPQTLARIGNMLVLYHRDLSGGHTLGALEARLKASGFETSVVFEESPDRGWLAAVRPGPA